MKRTIVFVLGVLMLFSTLSFFPISAKANSTFIPINSGDEISWEVIDYNETNNVDDPADWWRPSDWMFMGEYNLTIGELINFTVSDPASSSGALTIGTLDLSLTERHAIGFNLICFTGPAGFYTYSFDPAFLSPTNWAVQNETAMNASAEQGATMIISTYNGVFLGTNRALITYFWNNSGTIGNATYDYETGVLVHLVSVNGNWHLEIEIHSIVSSAIPGFEGILVLFTVIGLLALLKIFKKPQGASEKSI